MAWIGFSVFIFYHNFHAVFISECSDCQCYNNSISIIYSAIYCADCLFYNNFNNIGIQQYIALIVNVIRMLSTLLIQQYIARISLQV